MNILIQFNALELIFSFNRKMLLYLLYKAKAVNISTLIIINDFFFLKRKLLLPLTATQLKTKQINDLRIYAIQIKIKLLIEFI